MKRAMVVAEAGVNHNGSLERALSLVDAAAEAGADAVKFQTFTATALAAHGAPKADYQVETTGVEETQDEMLRRLELDEDGHRALMARCARRGIEFLSSAFDLASVGLLERLGVSTLKVPSGQITDLPYLKRVGALGRSVMLSTGMADLGEVGAALDALVSAGTALDDITVLHCTSEYPTLPSDVNLCAMLTMRDEFGVRVGYSDHTRGIYVAVAAVALGAAVIEKHFTLDRTLPGPDHEASLEPGELAALVGAVREVEAARGDGVKVPTPGESANAAVVRKSIVAARDIAEGETYSEDNITTKRPAGGISPMRWDEVLGRRAPRALVADEQVEL